MVKTVIARHFSSLRFMHAFMFLVEHILIHSKVLRAIPILII